jgi:leader peptidase (prepilin peptidase)/N-methyltransferase
MNALLDPVWFFPVLAAPFVGSFLGVLIARLPHKRPVVFARSVCPDCGTALRGPDLVPLLSFLVLRGRCRHCRQQIPLSHLLVELAAVLVAVIAVLTEPDADRIWLDCGLGWTLLTLGWIDATEWLLPDLLTLPLLLAGLMVTYGLDPEALVDHALAAALAWLAFQGLALAYRRLRQLDGLGGGDAKLIAAAGAWCGVGLLPYIVLGSAGVGLLLAAGLAVAGRTVTARTAIPFGPCIALVFWLAWLYGAQIEMLIQFPSRS